MSNAVVDRNLLLGLLALQHGMITRDQLVAAFSVWMLDKQRTLDEILLEQRALSSERQTQLRQMAAWHVEVHGSDPAQSLAAVSSVRTVCELLAGLGDADLHASLQRVDLELLEGDAFATRRDAKASAAAGLRYKSLRPHAKGALGEVSVALDCELHREVALKEIQPEFADHQDSRDRFVLEAEITGGLEHPGIVPVYGLGQYSDGRPFYAMRFIRGDSLKDAIAAYHHKDNPALRDPAASLSALRQLLRRFIDVCNAMEYAHSRGVLHRDLKPGNVMLGKFGETLVVDWGLAKSVGRKDIHVDEGTLRPVTALSSSGMTLPGSAVGTPAYMSPEQACGRLKELGPTTDVYGLGATLYHVLTGSAPFQGKVNDVLQQVIKGQVQPLRARNPAVSRAMEAICLKAMSLKPSDRYPNAKSLAEDVEHWLADEPVSAYREPWTMRFRRWGRQHRTLMTSGTIVLVASFMLMFVIALLVEARRRAIVKEQFKTEGQRIEAVTAQKLAEREGIRANENVKLERQQRARADAKEREARRFLYIAHMNLAQTAWDSNRVDRIIQLLEPYGKQPLADELRGFEWYYWNRLCHRELRTLQGHKAAVKHVAFSPDGKRLASTSDDGTIKVWEAATGRELHSLEGHTSRVECAAFSPDGTRIASGGYDKTIRLWNPETGQELHTLKGHFQRVMHVAFSPNGQWIVSASDDKWIRLWNVATGLETPLTGGGTDQRFLAFNSSRTYVALQSDGALRPFEAVADQGKPAAVVRSPSEIKLWGMSTGQELQTLPLEGHGGGLVTVAFSPDGQLIASAGSDPIIQLWDVATGQMVQQLKGHTERIASLVFSPDGTRIASASNDRTIKVWDAETGAETQTLKGHAERVVNIAYSPDGTTLASASDDGTIKLWDTVIRPETGTLTVPDGFAVQHVAFSLDGQLMASWSHGDSKRNHSITVWDTTAGVPIQTLTGHSEQIGDVVFSPDGKQVASTSADQTSKLWDTATGQEIWTRKNFTEAFGNLAFSPKGTLIVGSSTDRTVLRDAKSGEEIQKFEGDFPCVFSGDEKLVAFANHPDLTIKVWNLATWENIYTLEGHTGGIVSLAFNPEGTRIASASFDKTIKLWDLTTGREKLSLNGLPEVVESVAFSPDGKRLASADGRDRAIRLWEADTGKMTHTLTGHTADVVSVAFSPDGTRIASVGDDRTIKLWEATTGQETLTLKGMGRQCAFSPDGRRIISAESDGVKFDAPTKLAANEDENRRNTLALKWHSQAADCSEQNENWFAAYFHLRRLTELNPADMLVADRLSRIQQEWTQQAGQLLANRPSRLKQNLAYRATAAAFPKATASHTFADDDVNRLNDGICFSYDAPNRWTSLSSANPTDWIELEFEHDVSFSRVELAIYKQEREGVESPERFQIEIWDGTNWREIPKQQRNPIQPTGNQWNAARFEKVTARKLRVVFTHRGQARSGLTEIAVWP